LIAFAFSVLSAIHFHNKVPVPTEEIDHVRPNRLLSHKFETSQSPIAHGEPQLHFSVCSVLPQFSSFAGGLSIWSPHQWPPHRLASSMLATLSPQERGEGKEFAARPVVNQPVNGAASRA
jgi:hypothetical protein